MLRSKGTPSVTKTFADLSQICRRNRRCSRTASPSGKSWTIFFAATEERLRKREQDVSAREKALEEKIRTVTKQLDKRESAIASRESESMQRVQEQRDAAFAALEEERKKWMEEKSREKEKGSSGKGKDGSERARRESERKESNDKAKKENERKEGSEKEKKEEEKEKERKEKEKEKEKEKVQEEKKKEEKAKDKEGKEKEEDKGKDQDKASASGHPEAPLSEPGSSRAATAAATAEPATASPKDAKAKSAKAPKPADESAEAVRVSAELRALCAGMDAEGLKRYVMQNRREISRVRAELPLALPLALDPCRLVLSCLDSYKPASVESGGVGRDKRREPVEPTHVRAVSLLVETLGQILAKQAKAEGVAVPVIAPSIQEQARGIVERWVRSGGPLAKAEEASGLDAWLVLQVAAVFRVGALVDQDALLGFVAASSRRKQTAEMVKAMGLADKMPGGEDRGCHVEYRGVSCGRGGVSC
ncbi:hypothetical protein CLOM_g21932 [Closterium sp. NIES-68]|nr:hypothetical protein CLOM_g21932 [Closterium sp. NIES-68]